MLLHVGLVCLDLGYVLVNQLHEFVALHLEAVGVHGGTHLEEATWVTWSLASLDKHAFELDDSIVDLVHFVLHLGPEGHDLLQSSF